MAYRNNTFAYDKTDAHRALERFALAGRRRRLHELERLADWRKRDDAKKAKKQARADRLSKFASERRRERSTTRAGVFTHVWLMVYMALNFLALLPLVFLTDAGDFWLGMIAVGASIPLLGWVAAAGFARRGRRREVKWIESRPFPVTAHLAMLGAELYRPKATIEFLEEAPTDGLVRDVVTSAALSAPRRERRMLLGTRDDIEHGDRAVRLTMPMGGHGLFQHDNYAYRRWLHAVVDRVATELHKVYPVARVAVTE